MNVMAQAHKATRILIKASEFSGISYKEIFKAQLKLQHKRAKMTVSELLNDIDSRAQEFACPHLPFPSQLAYSFTGNTRHAEVFQCGDRGLILVLYFQGRVQLKAQCTDNEQAKMEAQRWMSFDKK